MTRFLLFLAFDVSRYISNPVYKITPNVQMLLLPAIQSMAPWFWAGLTQSAARRQLCTGVNLPSPSFLLLSPFPLKPGTVFKVIPTRFLIVILFLNVVIPLFYFQTLILMLVLLNFAIVMVETR